MMSEQTAPVNNYPDLVRGLPTGQPGVSASLRTTLRIMLCEKNADGLTAGQAMMRGLIRAAEAGNVAAAKFVFELVEGMILPNPSQYWPCYNEMKAIAAETYAAQEPPVQSPPPTQPVPQKRVIPDWRQGGIEVGPKVQKSIEKGLQPNTTQQQVADITNLIETARQHPASPPTPRLK